MEMEMEETILEKCWQAYQCSVPRARITREFLLLEFLCNSILRKQILQKMIL